MSKRLGILAVNYAQARDFARENNISSNCYFNISSVSSIRGRAEFDYICVGDWCNLPGIKSIIFSLKSSRGRRLEIVKYKGIEMNKILVDEAIKVAEKSEALINFLRRNDYKTTWNIEDVEICELK